MLKNLIAFFFFTLALHPSLAAPERVLLAAEDDWYPYSAKIDDTWEAKLR